MKRMPVFLSILLILSLLMAGCIAPAAQPVAEAIHMTDGLGREVTLAAPAAKIISLAPSITETLYALGAGGQLIGRDEFSDYPAEAGALPSVGGNMGDYNYEAIASMQPDLVLATEINTPEQVQSLENLGLTIYYLPNPTDMESNYTNLQTLGALLGREKEADALVKDLRARVKAVQDKLANVSDLPLVFYELDGTDPAKPWTPGPGTFVDQLVGLAKGVNVGGALDSAWAQISQEELLLQNPQIILLGDAAYGVTAGSVAARPGWDALDAVQNDRIYPFDDDLVSRPGPRLVDGLEALAALLHPEIFK